VIVTVAAGETPSVVTVKVAEVAWAATVTLAGTVAAAVLLLDSVTTAPAGEALPVSVTVPVELVPETTAVGLTATEEIAAGLTVRVGLKLTPSREAVIDTVAVEATPNVVTVKVAEVAPEATVTVAGTVAAAVLELVRPTIAPPGAAGVESVTVPVELVPAMTLVGETVRPDKAAELNVSVPFTETVPTVA